ncbi:MAG: PAS domain-containing protein, partial [Sphingomonas sp.]|nr:PAS domain-containing protein [Sphingomonas sp.]
MYEAPDRYKRMISARLPDGESLGVASQAADEGSSPLRDAQLIARGQFAPFFAIANSIAAVMMAMILYGHVPASYLGGWAVAVIVTNLGAMQLARTQAVTHVGRSGRKLPKWQMVGDIVVRAFVWLSLPVISFSSLEPSNQVVAATLIAGLGIAALGLVVVPACVTAWMAIFTAGLSYSLLVGRGQLPFDNILAVLFTLGVAIVGVLTVARWAFGQLKTNADFGSQSESASLLLQEYEQRGVGWLWQVDSENRVTYISSRMTALLGRRASALLGHSLPSLLGGHAELGKVLLEKQPF